MTRESGSNVISKTLSVIRAFTDRRKEWGVNELARYLEIPASSLHRILKILKTENILEMSAISGKYTIGPELIRISSIVAQTADIKAIAKPCLVKLSESVNESVYLGLYYPYYNKMAFVDAVHSSNNALQYVLEIGILHPLYIASSGKSILAFLEPEAVQKALNTEELGDEDRRRIGIEIETIRNQGYAITKNERKIGAYGISAPVFGVMREVVGCVTCVIPVKSFDESAKDEVVRKVRETAMAISHSMGHM